MLKTILVSWFIIALLLHLFMTSCVIALGCHIWTSYTLLRTSEYNQQWSWFCPDASGRVGKTTAIRLLSVWETSVSRPYGGSNWVPLNPLEPSHHYGIDGFKEALNWATIILKHARLSDNSCNFFQSGIVNNKNPHDVEYDSSIISQAVSQLTTCRPPSSHNWSYLREPCTMCWPCPR